MNKSNVDSRGSELSTVGDVGDRVAVAFTALQESLENGFVGVDEESLEDARDALRDAGVVLSEVERGEIP